MKFNLFTFAVVSCLLAFALWRIPDILWTRDKYLGAAILCFSFPLFVLARIQLGASFSVAPKARALVTSGLYSRIRNPIYVFGGLLGLGTMLFCISLRSAVIMAIIVVPIQIIRARKEEKVLTEAFGEEYIRYKDKTWF